MAGLESGHTHKTPQLLPAALRLSTNTPAIFSWYDEPENYVITFYVGATPADTTSNLLIAFNSAKAQFQNTAGASPFAIDAEIDQVDSSKINL